jgi:hypothetical protein
LIPADVHLFEQVAAATGRTAFGLKGRHAAMKL